MAFAKEHWPLSKSHDAGGGQGPVNSSTSSMAMSPK